MKPVLEADDILGRKVSLVTREVCRKTFAKSPCLLNSYETSGDYN